MAMTLHDDALGSESRAGTRSAIDVTKIMIWVVAVVVPWMAIIAAGKLLIDLLG